MKVYKEDIAEKTLQEAEKTIITHDDKLLLRAEKSKMYSDSSWKIFADHNRNKDGAEIITAYWNDKKGKESKFLKAGDEIPEGWKPCYEWKIKGLPEGMNIILRHNEVNLILTNLYSKWDETRYRLAMDAIISAGEAIPYNPREGGKDPERNRKEAMRQILNRNFFVAEYEWNLLIMGQLGREIKNFYRNSGSDKYVKYDNTVYLQGYGKYKGKKKVKIYSISEREGNDSDLTKIEITLFKQFFKDIDMREPKKFLEQPDIQEKIFPELKNTLNKHLKELSGDLRRRLYSAMGINEITEESLKSLTLTSIKNEIEYRQSENNPSIKDFDFSIDDFDTSI